MGKGQTMKECRDCKHKVSEQAYNCPNCGAMYPAKPSWDGWGYEYKSKHRKLLIIEERIRVRFDSAN